MTALLGEDNIVFIVTDAAWPLSMVWMLVVGVSVIAAKRLPGCWRIVPVLCPLWLPISIIGDIAFGEVGNAIGSFSARCSGPCWATSSATAGSESARRPNDRTQAAIRACEAGLGGDGL